MMKSIDWHQLMKHEDKAGTTFLLSLIAFSLSGCSTLNFTKEYRTVEERLKQHGTPSEILDSLEQVHCQPLSFQTHEANEAKQLAVINELSPQIKLPSGKTPFLAYQLPENTALKMEVDSFVVSINGKKELFDPAIALLDREKNIVGKIPEKQIKYRPPSLTQTERISAQFTVDPLQADQKQVDCLLIYTTSDNRKKTTRLFNEAKEYARVRGVVPPPIPDPIAHHGNLGHLSIALTPVAYYGQPLMYSPPAPVAAYSSVGAITPTSASTADPYMKKAEQYYVDKIQANLKKGDISAALDTRSEYKEMVRAIEGYFVSQFGKSASAPIKALSPEDNHNFSVQALHHFQNQVSRYLEKGEGSRTLDFIDQLKLIQRKLDNLFNTKKP